MPNHHTFTQFYLDITGSLPSPTLEEHTKQIISSGQVPDTIRVDTLTEKNDVILSWVYALSFCLHTNKEHHLGRRLVIATPEPMIIDQVSTVARNLKSALDNPHTPAITWVAEGLSTITDPTLDEDPLFVTHFHGLKSDNRAWLLRAGASILTTTATQASFRLLGVSPGVAHRSARIHAGLLGRDATIMLHDPASVPQHTRILRALSVLSDMSLCEVSTKPRPTAQAVSNDFSEFVEHFLEDRDLEGKNVLVYCVNSNEARDVRARLDELNHPVRLYAGLRPCDIKDPKASRGEVTIVDSGSSAGLYADVALAHVRNVSERDRCSILSDNVVTVSEHPLAQETVGDFVPQLDIDICSNLLVRPNFPYVSNLLQEKNQDVPGSHVTIAWRDNIDPDVLSQVPVCFEESLTIPVDQAREIVQGDIDAFSSGNANTNKDSRAIVQRLSQTRLKRRGKAFEPASVLDIQPGDVVILQSDLGGYVPDKGLCASSVRVEDKHGVSGIRLVDISDAESKLTLKELGVQRGEWVSWIGNKVAAVTDEVSKRRQDHFESVLSLSVHMGQAAARVRAQLVGVDPAVREPIVTAAGLHDIGKMDSSFQRMLGALPSDPFLAKSSGRKSVPSEKVKDLKPHAQLGADMVSDAGASDLVAHLVFSHHGIALSPWFDDLSKEWSPWDLAWMEAQVRTADWVVSGHPDYSGVETVELSSSVKGTRVLVPAFVGSVVSGGSVRLQGSHGVQIWGCARGSPDARAGPDNKNSLNNLQGVLLCLIRWKLFV